MTLLTVKNVLKEALTIWKTCCCKFGCLIIWFSVLYTKSLDEYLYLDNTRFGTIINYFINYSFVFFSGKQFSKTCSS